MHSVPSNLQMRGNLLPSSTLLAVVLDFVTIINLWPLIDPRAGATYFYDSSIGFFL